MRSRDLTKLLALLLFALFIGALLLTLVAGVRVYSQLVTDKSESDALRYANGLIVNSVKGADAFDAVLAGDGPEGRSLVLVERTDSGTFETRIYGFEGKVLQEYSPEDAPYGPENAIEVMDSQIFGFTFDGSLLQVTTDQGTTDIDLMSSGRRDKAAS